MVKMVLIASKRYMVPYKNYTKPNSVMCFSISVL